MRRVCSIIALCFVSFTFGLPAHGGDAKSVIIRIENKTPKFEPRVEVHHKGTIIFTGVGNLMEATLQLSPDWFTQVSIKLSAKSGIDGEDDLDFDHLFNLRFTRDSLPDYKYPIYLYFGTDRSNREMDRVDSSLEWEKYFRSIQIARWYRRNTYQPKFEREATTAVDAATELAEIEPYNFIVSKEAIRLYTETTLDKSKKLTQVAKAKGLFWNDLKPMVDKYADNNDCATVRLMLKGYEDDKDEELSIYKASRVSRNIFTELRAERPLLKCFPGV